jgi:hypothetical protein
MLREKDKNELAERLVTKCALAFRVSKSEIEADIKEAIDKAYGKSKAIKEGLANIENFRAKVKKDKALDLYTLIFTAVHDTFDSEIDWWIEKSLEEYRRLITFRLYEISKALVLKCHDKKELNEDDVRAIVSAIKIGEIKRNV